ncbi:MAG: four helix bundle protein [Anaerolineae bacterium]
MGQIRRFEDIQAWQRARELTKAVYVATEQGRFAKDFPLRDQIRRASLSIMLNIAEGFARRSNKEFVRFLFIAHGSTAEVQSALYVAKDLNYLSATEFDALYQHADEIARMLSGFIKYLENNK